MEKWIYDRKELKFETGTDIVEKLNELGNNGWEVINYKEVKPEKFDGKYECTVIVKRLKPA